MKKFLNLIVILISLSTLFSGLTQVVKPAFVLNFIGAEISPISLQLFATIGMFMAVFGLLMLHVVYSAHTNSPAILWCAVQKLGAAVAVGLGILNGLFAPIAAAVAVFDLFSGGLFIYYMQFRNKHENS